MKKILLIPGLLFLGLSPLMGQTEPQDSAEIESFDEILISAQRLGEKRSNTTRQIEIISAASINLAQQPTMAEVLSQTGQVFVQKSQLGGGSPVLRGFEASRVLLVVDGVRMNNATYRAGHLQDIVTIDPFMLDRTEIYFGSGSTLYGSDALGGVIYLRTRQPKFTDSLIVRPTGLARYSTAGGNYTFNGGWDMSSKNVSWLFNYSFNRYGDLRMGGGKNYSEIDTFGYRGWYVQRFNGKDSVIKNDNPLRQTGSGYDQSDYFSKLAVKHGKWISTLNLQASDCGMVPRYDRLTQVSKGTLRFAQWAYTPQNRYFASYTAELHAGSNRSHRFIASAQRTEVGRLSRLINDTIALVQQDHVNMYAFNYDNRFVLSKKVTLQSGAEYVYNTVEAQAFNNVVTTGKRLETNQTRYADSFANTHSASVFGNALFEIKPENFTVTAGLRISYYSAVAAFSKNNFWNLNYGEARVQNVAPVWNLGVIKKITSGFFTTANVSTGFRNPNIDDLTKLSESAPGIKYITPNTDLKAERTTAFDFGLRFVKSNKFNIETGAYYTKIANLLIDQPYTINGQDSFFYAGQMTRIFRMENTAQGFVRGAFLGFKVKIVKDLYGDFYYAGTYGRYQATKNAKWVPLDHVAPDHGRVGIRYSVKRLKSEAYMLFNGWKQAKNYSPSGEDNANQAPLGRTPSWQTYNLRGSYSVKDRYFFTLAVENILDLNYRVFSSGINAPGRNIIASIRVSL